MTNLSFDLHDPAVIFAYLVGAVVSGLTVLPFLLLISLFSDLSKRRK